jgi:hypothetical protein
LDEVTVHDVEVHQVGAAGLALTQGLSEVGQVGGEDGRREEHPWR